ncbi:MAG: SidA/IucD/PvdA family monooxygenase [Pseudomonadota bacterium]
MQTSSAPLFDILGIGFGPSNMALAIAMDDLELNYASRSTHQGTRKFSRCFIEKQEQFMWHGGMLLPFSDMQISFMKDLVSLRNPTSPFTFINYLRQCNRLEAFINRKTFFPSRIEFNAYLTWVANHFKDRCSYGESVSHITPEYSNRRVSALNVHSHDRSGREITRRARSLVMAVGGKAYVPEPFATMKDTRIIHSSQYLTTIAQRKNDLLTPLSIAVIGSGQSAAEILLDLYDRFPNANIDLIMRSSNLKPSEDGPSINTIFNPSYTDFFYSQSQSARNVLLQEFRNTNYAVVDADLIEKITEILYEQDVMGAGRLRLLTAASIQHVNKHTDHISMGLVQRNQHQEIINRYQLVVLATGYTRDHNRELLKGLEEELPEFNISRHYQLKTPEHFIPPIFIQGASENTHGLADTLLSVIAIRSQEIAESLTQCLEQPLPLYPLPSRSPAAVHINRREIPASLFAKEAQ